MRASAALALSAVAAALFLATAGAQQPPRVAIQDGREGQPLLDLREADSAFEKDSVRFTLVTWGRWRARALLDRAYFVVDLDPQRQVRYRIVVRATRHHLVGVLYRKTLGRDKPLRGVRVWRRDRHSVSVRVPARSLGLAAPGRYTWRVQSLVSGNRCARICFDRAPETGDAVVDIPGPGP